MAKHKIKTSNLSLTWQRLSSRELWSWNLALFAAVTYGLFTFLMDFLRTENGSWLWFVTYGVSYVVVFALALFVKFILLPRFKDNRVGVVNLVSVLFMGAIKNGVVAIMADALELEKITDIKTRFFGGGFMGVSMLATFAAVSGARGAHKIALTKLAKIQSGLLGARESLTEVLQDEIEKLQLRSRETVLPKIAQIEVLLGDDSNNSELIDAITDTVQNRVRPLMQELSQESIQSFSQIDGDIEKKIRVRTPRYFVMRDAIRPFIYASYMVPGTSLLLFFFEGMAGVLIGAISGIVLSLLHGGFRAVLPKRPTGKYLGYFVLGTSAVVFPIPSLFIEGMNLEFNRVESYVAPIVTWVFFALIPITLAPMFILDRERENIEAQIESENASLSKELTVFEQRLWVFKRKWQLMLHGTVQGALTAALTRLKTFSESDPYQASLVKSDLERVVKALQTIPSEEIDFANAMEELKESWEGVCAVRLDIDMRAERALGVNYRSAYCANEVIKEAIGNAVRHGAASAATVSITRVDEDFLDIKIQNNGTPVGRRFKRGIGSRMLDDITTEWSLIRDGKLTTLKARLPL